MTGPGQSQFSIVGDNRTTQPDGTNFREPQEVHRTERPWHINQRTSRALRGK